MKRAGFKFSLAFTLLQLACTLSGVATGHAVPAALCGYATGRWVGITLDIAEGRR